MTVRRRNDGLLAGVERRAVSYLLPKVPTSVNSDHLTLVAFLGAAVASASLIALSYSIAFVAPFIVGMFLNWLGDSLDGALARFRRRERPKIGFMMDKTCDLLSLGAVVLAMGQAGFMSPFASLMIMIAYLMHTIYGLMRVVIDGVQIIGVDGFGATEGRISAIAWVGVNLFTGFYLARLQFDGRSAVDMFTVGVAGFILVRLLRNVTKDVERLQLVEGAASPAPAARAESPLGAVSAAWSPRQAPEGKAVPTRSPNR